MKSMNSEIKKVVTKVKAAQVQLQSLIQGQDWVEEARKYAKRQGKEVKKLFGPDVEKMKTFLERERKELERFQKQIPSEVKKLRKFVDSQKKEFEKLLTQVRKMSGPAKKARKATGGKAKAKKAKAPKSAAKRKVSSAQSSTSSSEMGASL